MIRLSTLGTLDLRAGDGAELRTLLAQPKRLALLVYLAVARPRELHRRDRLLALFWPELDERRGRDALNQALHVLRQALGPEPMISRGAEDVGVDPDVLWCDATAFQTALDAGRLDEALDLYRGGLLEGFFVESSSGFEEWLEGERTRLRARAAQAARTLAEQHERSRNLTLAVDCARRGLELTGLDERALRRLIELLDRVGDRASAVAAYEQFAKRLAAELEVEPSAETRMLVERLRSSGAGHDPVAWNAPAVRWKGGAFRRDDQDSVASVAPSPAASAVATPNARPSSFSPISDAEPVPIISAGLGGAPVIDGYVIEREIDRGGAAIVYLARERKHDRMVAIKVLKAELAESLQADRFLQEIRIIAGMSHPHILPLLDSGRAGDLLYYITPYVEGESLRRRLDRERQLGVTEAIRIVREVAHALDHAHRHGIIHRDVKPENILLSDGHALVADFGIARAVNLADDPRLTTLRVAIGTPAYMSPEQAEADGEIDGRTDIYSLGCVLYELLAGRPPFRGTTPQVFAQHAAAPVPPLRGARPLIPTALERVVETSLAKIPGDRFSTAAAFAEALDAMLTRGMRLFDLWRRVRRWPVVRRVAGALVGIAAGAGALWAFTDSAATDLLAESDLSRIAVLYFDDLTAGAAHEHVAAGLTEDLIDELSQVRALHVISPEGVRPFRGSTTPLDSVVRALGVETLISGSLAASDSIVRLSIRLTDARSGQQLRSRTFEHPWKDLFVLQDELTTQVTEFLRERLGEEVRRREQRVATRSVYAWELVQRAEELANRGAAAVREGRAVEAHRALSRADTMFRHAAGIDPAWVAPLIGRGWLAISFAFISPDPATLDAAASVESTVGLRTGKLSAAWLLRAISHAEEALQRRPSEAEALTLLGAARYRLATLTQQPRPDTLLRRAEADLRTALDHRSDLAKAWELLASVHRGRARFVEAADAAQHALDADAYLTEIRAVVATLFFATLHTDRYEEARDWCRFGQERYPGDPRFMDCELTLFGWRGRGRRDVERAWRLLADIEREDSLGTTAITWTYRRMMVAAVLARTGMRDSARAVVQRTRSDQLHIARNTAVPIHEAFVFTLLGDADAALPLLSSHLDARPEDRDYVALTPLFRSLHGDSRFRSLVRISAAEPIGLRP